MSDREKGPPSKGGGSVVRLINYLLLLAIVYTVTAHLTELLK